MNALAISACLTYSRLLMFPDERYPLVPGKFRHLPVVENGEVIAILDIAKCLYDAIARMERAAEKGKAIAAAVEGVERHWGTAASGLYSRYSLPLLAFILLFENEIMFHMYYVYENEIVFHATF